LLHYKEGDSYTEDEVKILQEYADAMRKPGAPRVTSPFALHWV
jgi:hypothetical protein